jgi:hypothetical protein
VSWFGDILHNIGHAASDVWHAVSGGVSDAYNQTKSFVDRTPLKGIFAPISATANIIHGENVGDSLGRATVESFASIAAPTAEVNRLFSSTGVGKSVNKVVDSFSGGFASRTNEASELIHKENFGSDLNKQESLTLFKDVGINAVEVGAVVATAGVASGAAGALGLGETAAGAAGAFAGLKVGAGVGSNLADNDILGAIGAAGSLVDSAVGIDGVGEVIGSLGNDPSPQKPAPKPASRPTIGSQGAVLEQISSGGVSASHVNQIAYAAAALLLIYGLKHKAVHA